MLFIVNGLIFTMEADEPILGDILIKDGKIAEIAERLEPLSGATVIDAKGMLVYPGLIDAHSHIGISEEKTGRQGDDCNESTQPVTPCMRAIDAINPMDSAFHNAIAAGITGAMVGPGSANAVGGQFAFIKTDGRRVDDMVVLAPAAMKIAFGENPKTCYGMNGNMPVTRMGIASLIREELFQAKQYFDGGGSPPSFIRECYRGLFDGSIPLKAHAHRADDIFSAIRIAKEFGLGLTIDHCTDGYLIADDIARSGFPAIVGPSLASRSKNEVNNLDFKLAGALSNAGVLIAITTDHPVTRIQYLPLCAALAAKEGLNYSVAMRAITINAARICRVDSRIGSIKKGKDADIAIFDSDPLTIAAQVRFTLINGNVVYASDKNPEGMIHQA